MMWTRDPELDAERYYNKMTASRLQFERENYKGNCPCCGKPMFDGAMSIAENAVYDDETDEYYHEACLDILIEEREETEEAFNEQMGNPMDALDRLMAV